LALSKDVNGHVLAMIASGVCEADAYYRGPYEGGAAFLLIKDAAFPRRRESPLARLGHVFPQAIAAFAIADHRLALTSYLDQAGIAYQSDGDAVVVREAGEVKRQLGVYPRELAFHFFGAATGYGIGTCDFE
jgi:hypothetical protein